MGVAFFLGVAVGLVAGAAMWRRAARDGDFDSLTGVGSRRTADEALRTLRAGDAVVMVDLDDLKTINDTQGHAAGDQLLTAVAAYFAERVRAGDAVTRWGGDEFMILLRNAGDAAAEVLERLRLLSPATFSAGVAVHVEGPGESTLARADAALLAAKRAGGGRVCSS